MDGVVTLETSVVAAESCRRFVYKLLAGWRKLNATWEELIHRYLGRCILDLVWSRVKL